MKKIIDNMVKTENQIYNGLQRLIKNEDGIDNIFWDAFDDWLEKYGDYCPAEANSIYISEYISDADESGVSYKEIKEMCDYWIECINNRMY